MEIKPYIKDIAPPLNTLVVFDYLKTMLAVELRNQAIEWKYFPPLKFGVSATGGVWSRNQEG